MGRYKHYQNFGTGGQIVFITTTCLDFVPLFEQPPRRTHMVCSLIDDCLHYLAPLHAFVIMPEHLHWICQVPEGKTVHWLINRIKTNASRWLLADLTASKMRFLSQQVGLNGRSVWQNSFRSYVLENQFVITQKVDYIHFNPVRRDLCAHPIDYPWSSAIEHADEKWQDPFELPCQSVLERLEASFLTRT